MILYTNKTSRLHISGIWTFGPSDRIRTCGILLPKQARYQLRYTRLFSFFEFPRAFPKQARYQLRYTRIHYSVIKPQRPMHLSRRDTRYSRNLPFRH